MFPSLAFLDVGQVVPPAAVCAGAPCQHLGHEYVLRKGDVHHPPNLLEAVQRLGLLSGAGEAVLQARRSDEKHVGATNVIKRPSIKRDYAGNRQCPISSTHQDVTLLRVSLLQALLNHGNNNIVRHQLASIGIFLHFLPERGVRLDFSSAIMSSW